MRACGYFSVVVRLIVVNESLLSLHSKQERTKQSFCWKSSSVLLAGRLTRSNSRPTVRKTTYKCYIFPFSPSPTTWPFYFFLKPTPDAGGTLAAVIVLACETGLLNSPSGDSHGHGRVVPTAADGHFWELGIPNGTGGISSIFKAHLGAERGGGRRTTSPGRSVGIQIVYTEDWGCEWKKKRIRLRSSYMHDNLCQLAKCIYCCQNTAAGAAYHLTAELIRQRPRLIFPGSLQPPRPDNSSTVIGSRK